MIHKNLFKGVLMAALLIAVMVLKGGASEDIAHTKHNLAVNPDIQASNGTFNLNGDICVFCHTPHGGRTDVAGGGAPLWNRRIPTQGSYTLIYDSPNFDKAGFQAGQPKGVSLACLSCHDGTIAFDSLINAPGSGGFYVQNKTGSGGLGTSVGLIFNGPGIDPTNKTFKAGNRTDNTIGGFGFFGSDGATSNGNTGGMEPFPNLSTDLRDDHPISMQIPVTDPQFSEILNNININSSTDGHLTGSNKVFWITRTGTLQTDKRDRLRAYPSDTGSLDSPYIECASCHNPHEASRPSVQPAATAAVTPASVNNSRFLRAGNPDLATANGTLGIYMNDRNAGSVLCLSCHQK